MKKILIAAAAFFFGVTIAAVPAFALECRTGQGTLTELDFKVDSDGKPLTNQALVAIGEFCNNDGTGYYMKGGEMPGKYDSPTSVRMAYENAKAFMAMLERLKLSDQDGRQLLNFVKETEKRAETKKPTAEEEKLSKFLKN
ncbi:MAG: hypothetical protein Q7S26_01055 [bacterium]|nr:hypothetical protein [bacterium]